MNIIYIGDSGSGTTSFHRADALRRLGHEVQIVDPYKALFKNDFYNPIFKAIHLRTGYRLLQSRMMEWVESLCSGSVKSDLIWVNGGELLGRGCLKTLKKLNVPIILYNNDDPTGGRDGRRFDLLKKSLSLYDFCAVVREPNVGEFLDLGAKRVFRIMMSYDEVIHRPLGEGENIANDFKSDVAFIGAWMRGEKRDRFLLDLIQRGVPISIWGARWEKSPYWSQLRMHYRGKTLVNREYVAAIQGAKVCIGMLSKGNRDLHTTRSSEIPYAGGVFCAERTSEHEGMFQDNIEAVFWNTSSECADQCIRLLTDEHKREAIRRAGMIRVRKLEMGNEDVCKNVILKALSCG